MSDTELFVQLSRSTNAELIALLKSVPASARSATIQGVYRYYNYRRKHKLTEGQRVFVIDFLVRHKEDWLEGDDGEPS
jgi:hypothetical protein